MKQAGDRDAGASNVLKVFYSVVALLLTFYAILTYQSLRWSPMFYVDYTDSERSKIVYASVEGPAIPGEPSAPEYKCVNRGRELFVRAGCVLCHGLEGKGGIINPNYIKGTTPRLDTLAEKMFLYDAEDVTTVLKAFESGKSLDEVEDLDVPRSRVVVAQYKSIVTIITDGNVAGKKDPEGSAPIDMPSFKERLSRRDIDDMIAYLLSIYKWEDDEEGEDR